MLGISGVPGAGKTTFAEALVAEVARQQGDDLVAHLPMDGFHLADVQLRALDALSRKGAPDTFDAAGYAATLARLRASAPGWVYAPGFERSLEQPVAAAVVVPPAARLVVTEGNYLLLQDERWRPVREQLTEVWFVVGDERLRLERLVARHVEFGKDARTAQAWVQGTDEPNARLVEASGAHADRHVLNGPDGWAWAPSPA